VAECLIGLKACLSRLVPSVGIVDATHQSDEI
jgi:hypothetical protein